MNELSQLEKKKTDEDTEKEFMKVNDKEMEEMREY